MVNNAYALSKDELIQLYDSSEKGLSPDQVIAKQEKYGINAIAQEKAPAWYVQLLSAFLNPFIGVLLLIGIVSLFMDVILKTPGEKDYKEIIVLGIMILSTVLLRFSQEFQSNKAAEALKSLVKTTCSVLRGETGRAEIDMKEIVPGDIVFVSAGDLIPADMRLFQAKDLFVSQSMLTGESMPVEKKADVIPAQKGNMGIGELENTCFMGTTVVSGSAHGIVIGTGNGTYLGSMAKALVGKRAETSFEKGVNSVSWLLIRFMLVMVPMVFLINGLIKGNWLEAFMFAITVAVGLTPEMLPMIVTTNLAKGAVNMSKHKVVVKRLNAIQNIGAMDILCTDKTGTLTLDKIVLERHLNVLGEDDDEVYKWAYLNSFHQTGLKNLMDHAILTHKDSHTDIHKELHLDGYKKLDEIPFDFNRRRMSVVLEGPDQKHILICKGAVEEMLDICSLAIDPWDDRQNQFLTDALIPMDATLKEKILTISRKLNEDGLRVLLIAVKVCEARPLTYTVQDESNMVVTGFMGFLDPPKPSAIAAINALKEAGIAIKVLTGDNEIVTNKICREVGIPVSNIIMGNDLEKMSDSEFLSQIDNVSILAKLSPLQKSRVVKLLQSKGHTVGFMGDGINDAGALRDADVGISVDTGVDIAKENADIILLEKDLMVLQQGVMYGRKTHGNILKYIKMTASSNFGNMFSMLGASALLPFLPILPVQILINNLLYDFSQMSIPWDTMDKEYLNKPQQWKADGIKRFMLYIGPISSIFDYVTFGILWFVFKYNSPDQQGFFQTGWFVESLLSQTLIVHMIRTKKIPFFQSWASAPVVAMTSLIMLIGIVLPFSPLATALKMQALPVAFFPLLLGVLLCYCFLTQLIKNWFINKFGEWL